jgi:hypothetical protein
VNFGFFVTVFERYLDAGCLAHRKQDSGDTRDFETVLEASLPRDIKRRDTLYEIWEKAPFDFDRDCSFVYQRILRKDYEEITEHYFGMSEAEEKDWVDRDIHQYMVFAFSETGYEDEILSRHKNYFSPHAGPLPKTSEEIIQACNDAPRKQKYSLIWEEKYSRIRASAIRELYKELNVDYQRHKSNKNYFLASQFKRLMLRSYREAIVNQCFRETVIAMTLAPEGMRSYRAVVSRLKDGLHGRMTNELNAIRAGFYPSHITEIPTKKGYKKKAAKSDLTSTHMIRKQYERLPRIVMDEVSLGEWFNMSVGEQQALVERCLHSLVSLSASVDRDATRPRPLGEVLPDPRDTDSEVLKAQEIQNANFTLSWEDDAVVIPWEDLNPVISILMKEYPKPPERIVAEHYMLLYEYGGGQKILSILREEGFEKKDYWLSRKKAGFEACLRRHRKEIDGAILKSLEEEKRLKRQFESQWRGGWDYEQGIYVPGICIYRKPQKRWVVRWQRNGELTRITPTGPESSVNVTFQEYPFLLVLEGYNAISGNKTFPYPDDEWCEKHNTPKNQCLRCETAIRESRETFKGFVENHVGILESRMQLIAQIIAMLERNTTNAITNSQEE